MLYVRVYRAPFTGSAPIKTPIRAPPRAAPNPTILNHSAARPRDKSAARAIEPVNHFVRFIIFFVRFFVRFRSHFVFPFGQKFENNLEGLSSN